MSNKSILDPGVLHDRGGLSALVLSREWAATPLGPIERWPQSLQIALRILLSSRYAMWLGWGPELTFFYNDAYADMTLGKKHPWALGRSAKEVWPEIWDDVGPRADSVMQSGVATWDEGLLLFLERSGFREETYHTFSYSPVPGDDGDVAGLLCVVTEDTERIIGERRLRTLRELAAELAGTNTEQEVAAAVGRRLANNAKDLPFTLTYLLDDGGQHASLVAASGIEPGTAHSPRTIDLADAASPWPAAAVVARGELVTVDDLAARSPGLPAGNWDRSPSRAALVPIAQQGQDRHAGFLVAGLNPFRPFDPSYRGFVELVAGQIAAGIANSRAYQEERRRAEALAELDRAKTAFFSNVSHEFRTPLTLMLGPLEELLGEPELGGKERDRLSLVQRNGQRLLKLVNNLLDFSRIEAGRIKARYAPTDLVSLTADIASVFRSAVERAGMRLLLSCEALPEAAYVDHEMWEKIVLNLLSNAFKYTFEGEIEVSLRGLAGGFELAVRDTGTGVPASELPKLWTRFHRVEGARGRTHEGSGIGLALVHELVKLHGGSVGVTSELGRGSRFSVVIPRGHQHLPAERIAGQRSSAPLPVASAASSFVEEALRWLPDGTGDSIDTAGPEELGYPSRSGSGERARIVLADDNADMRGYVQRLLGDRHDVIAVADGQEALELSVAQRPDLVITDVMMPRLDGFGLLRALREDARTGAIPVIMLSARAGEEARLEGLGAGADDYLIKPFSARELIARVSGTLALSRFRTEALRREEELQAELRRGAEQLKAVAATAVAVSGVLSVEEVLQTVTDRAREIIGAHEAVTALARDGIAAPPLIARSWSSERALADDRAPPIVELDGVLDLEPSPPESLPAGADRLAAALVARDGRRVGALRLAQKRAGAFTAVDAAILQQLAQTASVALANAQLYRAAEDARGEAEAANRMKDQFLATLSHELRTPLNAILGWSRILRSGRADQKALAEGLETIERNSKLQAQLIEDLLDLSRIVSGKLRLDVQSVTLAPVIEAAIAAIRPAAEAKEIRLRQVLDPLAGPVNGDPARLQQIIWNLLANAVKFTPRGGQVQVVLERVNSHVEISVSDTGVGIKPEFLPHIFERFRQADASTTRKHGGLGLGLSIVRQLVEMHGGTVRAKSPGEGKGATFSLALPIPVAHKHSSGASQQSADGGEPALTVAPLDGVKVLVVDDEQDSRELVRRILGECRAVPETAGSVREALEALDKAVPDVLLSDIGMPEHDGYELIRRVRERGIDGKTLPAVALTAFARPEDRRRALLAGFQMHLAKPVDPDELIAVVATLVGRTGGAPG